MVSSWLENCRFFDGKWKGSFLGRPRENFAMGTLLRISNDLALELEQLIGQCIAILGIRGSGKSNTAGVIFEELLKHNYPLSIVDIDGEYFGLKEKFEVLVVGRGEGVEIDIDVDCAGEIAQISMEKNVPVVLDLSGFLSDERAGFLKEYLTALWNLAAKLRRPYIIGIEEAHEFIPQGIRTELKELIARVALRGRKRGLGAIIISQRSAKVEKDVLTQAGILFLHRVVHEADMRVYGELVPWRKSEVKEVITALETGDCVFINGETILPIYVRERETFHAGFTPSLEVVSTPQLKQVSQSIIAAIERAKNGNQKKSHAQALKERIEHLEGLVAEKEKMIAELEEVARTLGYIKVEVPSPPLPEVQNISKAIVHSVEGKITSDQSVGESGSVFRVPMAPNSALAPHHDAEAASVIDIEGRESAEMTDSLPQAVKRHVDRLVMRVARKDLLHRRVLGFLVAHAPTSYSVDQIAAWTNCAQGVIEDDPPREFLDEGMIVRERRNGAWHYRSNLKAFVVKEFTLYQPDIGLQELHFITNQLRDRLSTSVNN